MEKRVKLFFPREMVYGNRKFEGGQVHELTEEVPGFINRWLKRGCVEIKDEVEEKEEEVVKKATKKKTKKKATRRKAVEKVEEKDDNEEKVNSSDES